MTPTINSLANSIDYFYEPVVHLYKPKSCYVMLKSGEWTVNYENFTKVFTNFENVLQFLVDNHLDVTDLHAKLFQTVCTKGYYHKMLFDEILELVGTEAMQKTQENWDEFSKAFEKAIKKSQIKLAEEAR